MGSDVRIALLNSMAGSTFSESLDLQRDWGVVDLDLKDGIFGKSVAELNQEECSAADEMIRSRGLSVHCMSTPYFSAEVEAGESRFGQYLERLDNIVQLARILQPRMIRLLAPLTSRRKEEADGVEYVMRRHPWLFEMYGVAMTRLAEAGSTVTIENQNGNCILSNPREVRRFFEVLERYGHAEFTWDAQNMWTSGTYPTVHVYEAVAPFMGYFHVKGGQDEAGSRTLRWRSCLEDASWPVGEIVKRVVNDGSSSVICLNPSHGDDRDGYDYENAVERDLRYVQRLVQTA